MTDIYRAAAPFIVCDLIVLAVMILSPGFRAVAAAADGAMKATEA